MILDVCCGSKMFWFQKKREDVVFMDIREEEYTICDKEVKVQPDIVGDFRAIPFLNNTFDMVVFDPPHLRWAGSKSIMRAQYGQLSEDWENDIAQGFKECFRVLRPGGFLVFKWCEEQIKLKQILSLTSEKPLFGNQRGKTFWLIFRKGDDSCS
ncbi:class I SAM-dependent methyltransferase [Holdemania filiformis]|uniref:class I SAM-dependent methyltransferase n=1 Tax=Holdemania filiformis TaxID=61171 RepID=UPI002675D78E|nr:class I SAM-dependent methyltransferase [Holdemania filiformis]